MRLAPVASFTVGFLALGAAQAADIEARQETRRDLPTPIALRTSFISETRIGLFAQDPWSPEGGTANLHAEILFARPVTPADLFTSYFIPRPHLGISLNLAGRTSFAFAGLTWSFDVTPRVFVEASLGGAIHNAPDQAAPGSNRVGLGCSPTFRESASVGYKVTERLSFMATIERLDNAGLCATNRGLTNIGARINYSF